MKPSRCLAATLLPLALASAVPADVVADYTFANASPASSGTLLGVAGNFTVSIAPPNGGLSATSNGGAYLKANVAYGASEDDAVTNGACYSFTITPTAGTALQLTSLTFQLGGTANSNGNFTVTAFLRTSQDNFASDAGTVTSGSLSYTVPDNNGANFGSPVTIDLSSLPSITATTTLRIYSYINTSNASGVYARINTVTLNAVTAIPEPSTYAFYFKANTGQTVPRSR